MSAIEQIVKDIMRSALRRYDVPPETHVTIEEVRPSTMSEASADVIELRMQRLTGLGLDAKHDATVCRLPGYLLRSPKGLHGALRAAVDGMCKDLFGVHEGEGLP